MILDFKRLTMWFLIKYWCYNTRTRAINWLQNVFAKSNSAFITPFGNVSCFVIVVRLSDYKLYAILMHQIFYSKEYQRYLMHIKALLKN